MLNIEGVNLPFIPINGVNGISNAGRIKTEGINPETPFSYIFTEELGKLKFSGHAISRMASREIDLTQSEITRLENAIQKLEVKNSKDSLVLMDEKAFIINIPNKTVVTMFTRNNLDENVVTKIDSAVFA